MSPVEVEFVYFLPLLFLIYWLTPRRPLPQNMVLLLASITFFAAWSVKLLPALAFVTIANYLFARALASRRLPAQANPTTTRGGLRLLFWMAIGLNVLELGYFKYEGFFATSLNVLLGRLGMPSLLPVLALVVPVGLSFRSLQNIGYLTDVYLGRQEGPDSFVAFALFAVFFPQMLAGPIARGSQMMPQYAKARDPNPLQWSSGAATLLLGFALKAFAADAIGNKLVSGVFDQSEQYSRGAHWAALIGFSLQVFADFGGYSLIAIGIGRLFGLELPMNFNFPFQSKSMLEFWRRWHITLNNWLFDYIFVPLTVGTTLFRAQMVAAFFVTFTISGLWHGAAWTFVFWGVLQSIGLSVQYLYDQRYKALCRKDRSWVATRKSRWYQFGAWFITQTFFVLTMIPFRAPTLSASASYFRRLLHSDGTRRAALTNPQLAAALLFVIAYCFVPSAPGQVLVDRFRAMPPVARGLAYGVAIAMLLVFTPIGSGTFIYAQF